MDVGYEAAPGTAVEWLLGLHIPKADSASDAEIRKQLGDAVTAAFEAKEAARSQLEALCPNLKLVLATSLLAERTAAYVRARDKFEQCFPK